MAAAAPDQDAGHGAVTVVARIQPRAVRATPKQRKSADKLSTQDCWGDEGHCGIPDPVSPFDQRAKSDAQPANVTVDITTALREVTETEEVRVTILAWPRAPGQASRTRCASAS